MINDNGSKIGDMRWFDELYMMRAEFIGALRKNQFEKGFQHSVVDKYADPTHFVYELLQNAEDQHATRAWFKLEVDKLTFGHDGAEFSNEDVVSITGVGNSEKSEHANKIGRFGIGFKSVFSITARPEVHTSIEGNRFSFAIDDLVVPNRLSLSPCHPLYSTIFVMPFITEQRESLYKSVLARLRSLGADSMLFLDCLDDISWESETDSGTYVCERSVETRSKSIGIHLIEESGTNGGKKNCLEKHYIQFWNKVNVVSSDRDLTVRVAFCLEGDRLQPEPEGAVLDVYFPTEEKTGLKFRVHAPMLLTDNRANVKRDNAINTELIHSVGTLVAESLSRLRALGLMSVSTLNCLPIEKSRFIGSAWCPVYDAVRNELESQNLLPTEQKSHVSALNAHLARSTALRKLVTDSQLATLVGGSASAWLSSEITESKTPLLWEYLLSEVGVREETPETFAVKLNRSFMERQEDSWLIEFYTFLTDVPSLWKRDWRTSEPTLRSNAERPILRLEDGRMVAPYVRGNAIPSVYLPCATDSEFLTVKQSLCLDSKAMTFFEELGLRNPNVVDELLSGPVKRLASFGGIADIDNYTNELSKIADAIEKSEEERKHVLARILQANPIVLGQRAGAPQEVGITYVRSAYEPTEEAVEWFDGCKDTWLVSNEIVDMHQWHVLKAFLSNISGQRSETGQLIYVFPKLRVLKREGNHFGHVSLSDVRMLTSSGRMATHYRRGLQGFDPSANIEGLDNALSHASIKRSHILWNLLLSDPSSIKGQIEYATHRTFDNVSRAEAVYSELGQRCVEAKWLPKATGSLHPPIELSLNELPEEFDKVSAKAQEVATKLGMRLTNIAELNELDKERMHLSHLAKVSEITGIPEEDIAKFEEKLRTDPEGTRAYLNRPSLPEFPSRSSPNPERRSQRVAKEALEAPERRFEVLQRSERTSAVAVAESAYAYLRDLYTNDDNIMVCQICGQAMPFRRRDGEWYFESVLCIRDGVITREVDANHLALCPTCAAKFKYVGDTPPSLLLQRVLAATETSDDQAEPISIEVELGDEVSKIRFVKDHICDLNAILRFVPSL